MRVSNRILLGLGILLFVVESPAQVTFLLRRPTAAADTSYIGPLDIYTNDLWGAWSVSRKLKSSYSGAAITLAVGGSTQDIGFTASGELDTNAVNTFCGSSVGYIIRIWDQWSTNHFQVTNIGTSFPMIFNGTTVNRFTNGRPAAFQKFENAILKTVDRGVDFTNPATSLLVGAIKNYALTNATRVIAGFGATSEGAHQVNDATVSGRLSINSGSPVVVATNPADEAVFSWGVTWHTNNNATSHWNNHLAIGGNPGALTPPLTYYVWGSYDNAGVRAGSNAISEILVYTNVVASNTLRSLMQNQNQWYTIW